MYVLWYISPDIYISWNREKKVKLGFAELRRQVMDVYRSWNVSDVSGVCYIGKLYMHEAADFRSVGLCGCQSASFGSLAF